MLILYLLHCIVYIIKLDSIIISENSKTMAESCLDALIRELESGDESQGNQDTADDNDPPENDESQSEGDIVPHPPDPGHGVIGGRVRVQTSPIIAKYISSSSARRRIQKPTHCNFCNQDHDRGSLSLHLELNERCKILYFRKLHVKSVDAILCTQFECLFCPDRAPRLVKHLEGKEECKLKYLQKFNVISSREAVEKVMQLKRTGFKSRRSLSRAMENEKAKRRRCDQMLNEPPENSLNSHLNRNLFANFKRNSLSCKKKNTVQCF